MLKAEDFGCTYNAQHNEFEGKAKQVERFAGYRRGIRTNDAKLPSSSYPKNGMFSIEARARLVS